MDPSQYGLHNEPHQLHKSDHILCDLLLFWGPCVALCSSTQPAVLQEIGKLVGATAVETGIISAGFWAIDKVSMFLLTYVFPQTISHTPCTALL